MYTQNNNYKNEMIELLNQEMTMYNDLMKNERLKKDREIAAAKFTALSDIKKEMQKIRLWFFASQKKSNTLFTIEKGIYKKQKLKIFSKSKEKCNESIQNYQQHTTKQRYLCY